MTRRNVPLGYRHLWALLVASGLLPAIANAAGLTITPASVPANYSGTITLNMSGLPSGQRVLVENFIDINGNAAVDAGDLLVQSFQVTDGQALSIGGVRNTNVPGDDDGAVDGKIRAVLSFQALAEVAKWGTRYVYRASAVSGGFTAVTAAFGITPAPLAQKVTGTITNGGSPVPYAFALLIKPNASPTAGTMADASGNFALTSAPGTFILAAIKNGFVFNIDAAPQVTINAGATVVQNISLTPATRSISGRLTDADSGVGLPGVQVTAQTSDPGMIGLTFTDADGNFDVKVSTAPTNWGLDPSYRSAALLGYLSRNDRFPVDTSGGNVSGVALSWPRATALIYGTLRDDQTHPLAGFEIDAYSQYESFGLSDSSGYYVTAAGAGSWSVGPDSTQLAALGYLGAGANVTLSSGQALHQDLVARHITAHLIGRVTDGGQPISDACITAYPSQGGNGNDTQTDANGNFSLGIFGGTWNLQLCDEDSQQRGLVRPTLPFNVTDGVDLSNIQYVVRHATAQITGQVKNTSDSPVENLGVSAHITAGGIDYNMWQRTSANGNYSLGVFNGTWQVSLDCGDLQGRGYICPSNQQVIISGANGVANFSVPLPGALQITTTSLPNGTQGVFYSVQLAASGGVQQYSWDLAPGSLQLPPELNLSSNGYLSGTPTNSGTFNFTVRVTDAANHSAIQALSLFITGQSLQVTTSGLPSGQIGVAYTAQLQASGGQPPYSWSLTPGSGPLPAGLNVASNGGVAGTPTSYGTTSFYIRVTDTMHNSVDRNLSISISPAPLELLTSALPNGHVGSPYSSQLEATGGVQPYTWMLAPGSLALPPGLMLDPGGGTPTTSTSGGLISGTPTAEGSFSFIVRVSDSYAQYIDRPLTVVIGPSQGTPTVTPTPTQTPTRTATPTPGPCFGDCNRNDQVTIDELVQGTNIALGHAVLDECARLNCNGTGTASVNCLLKAIDATLYGCVGAPP